MRFRKIALALFACMALGVFAANAARAGWTIEGVSTFPSSESITCSKHGTGNLTFSSTVTGIPFTLQATGGSCVAASINNGTGMDADHSQGKLKFTGVTVVTPTTCTVAGELETNSLTGRVVMDETAGSTRVFGTVFTDSGAIIKFNVGGAECPFAGAEPEVLGTACGELVHTSGSELLPNKTGELFTPQILSFGMTQQTTGNSATNPCKLTLGKAEATITGTVANELKAPFLGRPFAAD